MKKTENIVDKKKYHLVRRWRAAINTHHLKIGNKKWKKLKSNKKEN